MRGFIYRICLVYVLIAIVVSVILSCNNAGNGVAYSDSNNPVDTFSYTGYTELANVIAGKGATNADFLSDVTTSKAYETHKAAMTTTWGRYRFSDVDVIRRWSKENFQQKVDTVFYPFGGPDFNYLSSFFPDCRFSILVGLEGVGKLPFIDKVSKARYSDVLTGMRAIISSNVGLSYFHTTLNFEADLDPYLKGTMPVIMMYAALHGYEVITINPVKIEQDGTLAYVHPEKVFAHTMYKGEGDGFEMLYRKPGERGARKLYYLCSDLSNGAYPTGGMDKVIKKYLHNKLTFLKVASYLLHEPDFSMIRESLLDNSKTILSGPSGMPYSAYDKALWNLKLFGKYMAPIPQFADYPQDDLKAIYKAEKSSPIDFRFDYHSSASFILATKK